MTAVKPLGYVGFLCLREQGCWGLSLKSDRRAGMALCLPGCSRLVVLLLRLTEDCSSLCAGIDLIAAFYGCLYAGCVPITVRPPHPQNIATTLPTVKMIVEVMLPAGSGPSAGLVDYRAWAPGLVWASAVPAAEGAQPLCFRSLPFCSGIKIATCA